MEAVALLVGISWTAHMVAVWLTPVIPLVVAVALLVVVWTTIFGRRS